MRAVVLALGLAALAVPGMARAEETPRPGATDTRVRVVNYDPDQVYRVRGVFRSAVQVVFGAGEAISSVALGDTVSWEVAPADNVLFIKPREAAGPTNLLVITKRGGVSRSYSFMLSVRPGGMDQGSDAVFVMRFRYPAEEAAARVLAEQQALAARSLGVEAGVVKFALDAAVTQGARNLDYSVAGSSDLQPSEVTDNGEFTVMRFPRGQAVPAIFVVNADGSEAVVPYDVRGEFVVIHQLAKEFRLRKGRVLTCIWNNAFDRYGADLSSGTVSRDVERTIEGKQP
ncbi:MULTISPECIES: P-type conjugative transfer protein VirB9 [unclassified Novosphingobium]|uniref:P-type conjugative transfer protein VirB9 n=1 Tax=unclassified Novosphingobium TaxID=2644732 RepID=UPI00146D9DE6|nr:MULTISPECIES: P-type conjugative transfer protein VirB9 [unclassified Novosphingobium]NMN07543.1 type IV secretion system protein VirB9 [Novosphingobium sp. SG919]NMN89854.1 type IV secretion system protein VirB9 [Novosphingobium sp. SG916]